MDDHHHPWCGSSSTERNYWGNPSRSADQGTRQAGESSSPSGHVSSRSRHHTAPTIIRIIKESKCAAPALTYLYAAPDGERPASLDDLTRVARGETDAEGRLRLVPESTVPERWLVVWLHSVPSDGRYRGRVAEVRIRT